MGRNLIVKKKKFLLKYCDFTLQADVGSCFIIYHLVGECDETVRHLLKICDLPNEASTFVFQSCRLRTRSRDLELTKKKWMKRDLLQLSGISKPKLPEPPIPNPSLGASAARPRANLSVRDFPFCHRS